MMQTELSANHSRVVRSARRFVEYYIRGYHNLRLLTPITLPADGPAILACNHTSGLDPFLIQSLMQSRIIVWMMAREYYESRSLNWFFRSIDAIAVERNGRDLSALRMALRALEHGRIVGVFPEGRIAPGGQILPFQTGVGLLAAKSRAPVYPAWIDGSMRDLEMVDAYLFPHHAKLAFGPKVNLEQGENSREVLERSAVTIHDAVAALRDQYSNDAVSTC